MHGPTHNRGHTLDVLISRGLNISSIVIKDVALYDHFCISFDILISASTESRSVSVRKRCISENTSALIMKAISLTPSFSADSVDLLLDSFNSKVKNVIDDIAPEKVSKTTGRQKSSWRKWTAVQRIDPFNVCKHRKPRLGARAAWGQKNGAANRPAYCVKEKQTSLIDR